MNKHNESILFVDDEPSILSALRRLFRKSDYDCSFANSGQEGLTILEEKPIDLIVSDMRMPQMSGAEFLATVKERWPNTIRMLLTGHSDIGATIEALNKGGIYRYISKPWDDDEFKQIIEEGLRIRRLEREKEELLNLTQEQNKKLQKFNEELEKQVKARTAEIQQTADMLDLAYKELGKSYDKFIRICSSIISSRVFLNQQKASTVADLTKQVCKAANFTEEETNQIYYAALLHELGKLGLPDEILALPESMLNDTQKERYYKYPTIGEMILMSIEGLEEASIVIRHHMERFDGKGYPDHLAGKSIPKGARLLRATHDFIGLQLGTIEKQAMTSGQAYVYMQKNVSKIYDPGVVKIIEKYKNAFEVRSDGTTELRIDSFNLKSGMIVARDILNRNGIMLISKGYHLTNTIIEKLLMFEKLENYKLEIYIQKE
ncbi:response regulator [Zooshikella marina]|uniref:HD domain-containing phosphohydrolase n=1 Tax=Zooshikella ganghwensis TaxID=202772 RepID=UPI001BAF31B7|nr:HD domain-containing phosphohydrolase [Zooshikella ganghwensis]MBU2708655.1 response regulator [Zooshikella ganghwensis]